MVEQDDAAHHSPQAEHVRVVLVELPLCDHIMTNVADRSERVGDVVLRYTLLR